MHFICNIKCECLVKFFLIKQQTFETKVVNDCLYINTSSQLSKERPFKKGNEPEMNLVKPDQHKISENVDELNSNKLTYWAVKILETADPKEKANLTNTVAEKWFKGEINEIGDFKPPEIPARLESLSVIDPAKIRRGKGGTIVSIC